MQRKYTEDMKEISGFGGVYEQECRKMVLGLLDWIDANPDEEAFILSEQGVFKPSPELDAKLLQISPNCSEAMAVAAFRHVSYIQENGWPAYVRKMKK